MLLKVKGLTKDAYDGRMKQMIAKAHLLAPSHDRDPCSQNFIPDTTGMAACIGKVISSCLYLFARMSI